MRFGNQHFNQRAGLLPTGFANGFDAFGLPIKAIGHQNDISARQFSVLIADDQPGFA